MSDAASRDPFAQPGYPGNRGISYGKDGPIPGENREVVEKAIRLAYQLAFSPTFVKVFNETVSKLTNQPLQGNTYLDALDKMIINYAETSKSPKAVAELKDDAIAVAKDKTYQPPAAFSIRSGRDIWLRGFLLKKGDPEAIAGALMHEAAHLVGAPTDPLAEMGLERLGEVSGYRRK